MKKYIDIVINLTNRQFQHDADDIIIETDAPFMLPKMLLLLKRRLKIQKLFLRI